MLSKEDTKNAIEDQSRKTAVNNLVPMKYLFNPQKQAHKKLMGTKTYLNGVKGTGLLVGLRERVANPCGRGKTLPSISKIP